MDSEKLQEVAFQIILSSGDARTLVHEAFAQMRAEKFNDAESLLNEANDSLVKAHKVQTELLQQYANGERIEMEIIMVHAQDHLMTTMTLREVALEMLSLYKKVS
ncbi:PTS cellobiose transporter subunit IIA [Candidatus Enterococcus murrayae]|uniref:PTS cellobiose transporter subunit IIA n=1 Tax=Candidatus Enterococcus murrayae TaxID=2815321 RepID=A0ABS3HFU6_9ENTE|nr:PTS cellobiose transporter subunit IIA [Enterococcus sp. MJM16]MBO0451892.1 PTS cellobiose transporter subunit IIA [Enterococcus sp. MJM16]